MNVNLKNMNFIKFNNQIMNWVKFNGQLVYEAFKKLILSAIPPLKLNKCKESNLVDYKVYGNSVQKGTNIFDGTYKGGYIGGGKIANFIDSPTTHYLTVIPCKANTTYVVEKEYATERFVVGFTDEYPYTGLAVTNSVTDYTAQKIISTSGATSQYLVAFVYNTNLDTLPLPNLIVYEAQSPDNPIEVESVGDKTKNICPGFYYNYPSNDGMATYKFPVKANTYYSIHFDVTSQSYKTVWLYNTDNTISKLISYAYQSTNYNKMVVLPKRDGYMSIGIANNNAKVIVAEGLYYTLNATQTNNLNNNQITTSVTGGNLEYEPYGYKLPIKTRGKNIMPLDSYSNTSVWATKIISMSELLKDVKPGKQYTISGDFICESVPNGVNSTTIGFQFVKKNATSTIALTNAYRISLGEKVHISKSFTLPEDTDIDSYYGLYAYMNYSSTAKAGCSGRIENIQIEEGSGETEYVPYIEPIINNIYLKEPLRKIGDYADYIDFENQIVKRNIYQCKLIDVLPGNSGSQYATGLCRRQGGLNPRPNYDVAPISNCLVGYSGVIQAKANAITFASTYSNAYVYFKASELGLEPVTSTTSSTVIGTAINNYITEHDMDLTYVLAQPTEETIELPNISTIKGTTIIEVDTSIKPSNMKVAYLGKE